MNEQAWAVKPETPPNLEASLFKIQSLLARCRTINAQTAPDICKDLPKYKLGKYQTELVDSLCASLVKIKTAVDVLALVKVQGSLHRQLGAEYSNLAVPKILKTASTAGRPRTFARLTLDLYFEQLLPPASAKPTTAKVLEKVLVPDTGIAATIKMVLGYGEQLKDFYPLLDKFCASLEPWMAENVPAPSTSLMLSNELQRINEKSKEMADISAVYNELCALIGRTPQKLDTTALVIDKSLDRASGATSTAVSTVPSSSNSGTATPTTSKLKWADFEHKIRTMSSPATVTETATLFSSDANVMRKTQQLLVESQKTHLMPFYAQFLAQVDAAFADKIAAEILDKALENPAGTYLRYTAELIKANVLAPGSAIDVLIRLSRPQLRAQFMFNFAEACGGFLSECEPVAARLESYRDFLRKQPAQTPQDRQLIEGTLTYLSPDSRAPHPAAAKQDASVGLFVELLLYRELNKGTLARVAKLLKKLKQQELLAVVDKFVNCEAISADNLPRVAQIAASLASFSVQFAYRLLDLALEQFLLNMERGDNRQLLVSQTILVGSLQSQGLFTKDLSQFVCKSITSVPKDKFRLKLLAIFLAHARGLDASYTALLQNYSEGVELEAGSELVSLVARAFNALSQHREIANADELEDLPDEQDEDMAEDPDDDQDADADADQDLGDQDEELDEILDDEFEREFNKMVASPKAQAPNGSPSGGGPSGRPNGSSKGVLDFAALKLAKS